MKFSAAVLFAASLATVYATAIPDPLTLECGDLGRMDVNPEDLPPNMSMSEVRTCREHPATHSVNKKRRSDAAEVPDLFKRECNTTGKNYGCSVEGYCWSECGKDNKWCWTAVGNGFGPWITCSNDAMCADAGSCAKGKCKECGCSKGC